MSAAQPNREEIEALAKTLCKIMGYAWDHDEGCTASDDPYSCQCEDNIDNAWPDVSPHFGAPREDLTRYAIDLFAAGYTRLAALEAERDKARAEGIEEAAKVAEGMPKWAKFGTDHVRANGPTECATAIRALLPAARPNDG